MSIIPILSSLLVAVGGQGISADSAPGAGRTIEILIAGPKEARNRMDAAIHPLFSADSEIRWTVEDTIPTERGLPESDAQGRGQRWQIWIDVSHPMLVRVFLPAVETTGATTVRTLPRKGADGNEADESAREAVAQIVKAAVATFRGGPSEAVSAGPPQRVETTSRRAVGEHTHDGFYLRLQTGYGRLTATEDAGPRQYTKLGPSLNIAVGGALSPRLVLYAELLMMGVANVEERGTYAYGGQYGKDLLLTIFGPGVAYYFMPANVYLSTTVGLAKLQFVDGYTDDHVPDPDIGYAGIFTTGKEWWGSADWSVGIAAQLSYARSMKHNYCKERTVVDVYADSNVHTATVSLLFSATYN